MVNGRRENGFWPGAASDTDRPHGADFRFLRDHVMARAQRSNDHRTIALLAWKSRQVEIVRRGFQWAHECSIPGHWRHHPISNRIVAQLGNFRHRGLSFSGTTIGSALSQIGWVPGPRGHTGTAFETPFDNQYDTRGRISLPPIAHLRPICSIGYSNFPDKMP
jgi:hypothetical protein